ncbi:MAG: hypothetical protein V2I97_05655 [Desulfococcaceae bacterium]|jgi:hypothetical protein|nr:hypothetical protein [Desulfococcaceae bacterium]
MKNKNTVISNDSPMAWQEIITKEGRDYRERERIKRKIQRWIDNVKGMSDLERRAFFAAMQAQGFTANPPAAVVSQAPKSGITVIDPISVIPEDDTKPEPEPGHPEMKEWFIRELIKKYGGASGTAPIWKIRQEYPYKDFDLFLNFLAGIYRIEFLHGDPASTPAEELVKNPKDYKGTRFINCQWNGGGGGSIPQPVCTSADGKLKLKFKQLCSGL